MLLSRPNPAGSEKPKGVKARRRPHFRPSRPRRQGAREVLAGERSESIIHQNFETWESLPQFKSGPRNQKIKGLANTASPFFALLSVYCPYLISSVRH